METKQTTLNQSAVRCIYEYEQLASGLQEELEILREESRTLREMAESLRNQSRACRRQAADVTVQSRAANLQADNALIASLAIAVGVQDLVSSSRAELVEPETGTPQPLQSSQSAQLPSLSALPSDTLLMTLLGSRTS